MFQEWFSGPHASGLALSLVPQSSLAVGESATPPCSSRVLRGPGLPPPLGTWVISLAAWATCILVSP